LVGEVVQYPLFWNQLSVVPIGLCSIGGAIATKDFTDLEAYASGQASGLLDFGSLLLKGL